MAAREQEGLLGDAVYADLVDRIFRGELRSGMPLSVPALAAQLNVSRSPVRDSVQRLIADGLAVHTPHAGARVATLTEADVAQVMTVREPLDGLAAREAVAHARADDVAALRALLRAQEEGLAEEDPTADARRDLAFHTAIRDLARNRVLSDALHRLDSIAHLHDAGLWSDARGRAAALAEHTAIVDAIERGDVVGAEAAARAHVASLLVRMRRRALG
ncbi:GntR family transcriptional regulator [Microbacterium sp. NPDC055683]